MAVPLINPYLDLFNEIEKLSPEVQLKIRKKVIWPYSWAVPNADAVHTIASYSPLVELGAGSGYWSWLLRQAGAKVVSLDQEPMQPPKWCDVSYGTPNDVCAYQDHALLICWPPLDSSMAFDALSCFQGSVLIYVGEWRGRTANHQFHKVIQEEWNQQQSIVIPCWPGYSDQVLIFKRNQPFE
jgi:hypothetical protein